MLWITFNPSDIDAHHLRGGDSGRGDHAAARIIENFQQSSHREERTLTFPLWETYGVEEPMEVTDKRTNTGRFVGMPLRELPRTLTVRVRTSDDVSVVVDPMGVPGYIAQVALLRALRGHEVTLTTNTIPFFRGIVRNVSLEDDGRYHDSVNVTLEVRELVPNDFGDTEFPDRVRLEIPRESFDPAAEPEDRGTLNDSEICKDVATFSVTGRDILSAMTAPIRPFIWAGAGILEWHAGVKERTEAAKPDGIEWQAKTRGQTCGFGVDKESLDAFTRRVMEDPDFQARPRFMGVAEEVDFNVRQIRTIPMTELKHTSATSRNAVRLRIGGDQVTIGHRDTMQGHTLEFKTNGRVVDKIHVRTPYEDTVIRGFLPTSPNPSDAAIFIATDDESLVNEPIPRDNLNKYHLVILHGNLRSGVLDG